MKPNVLVVLGPTASGKSDLAVSLARKLNGEIISADSRQVYRGLDIGTGKITQREMKGIPHHLLDVADPRRIFSVTRYQTLGRAAIKKILKKGKLPIIVGGTGLYIDALIYDYPLPEVKPNPTLRRELEKLTTEDLFHKLQKKDPVRASEIDPHNRRRLIRALEILEEGPIPSHDSTLRRSSPYETTFIGLSWSPEELKNRIHIRLLKRLRKGMIQEIGNLLKEKKVTHKRLESLGLEYRYVSRFLKKEITEEEMVQILESEIWKYAKRQMTWFKRNKEILWVSPDEEEKLFQLLLEQ